MANQAGTFGQLMDRWAARRRGPVVAARSVSALLFCALFGAGWAAAPVSAAKNVRQPHGGMAKPDPDVLLIAIYQDMADNHLREAQAKADALVAAYPNFHLGQLVRGDLLLMHAQPITALGAGAGSAAPDKLKDLRQEAMVRLKSLTWRPSPTMTPRSVLQLRDDQKYVLVVDTRSSRLYVYQNIAGHLKLATDYYVAQGKLGINKLKEGDQKTPIGVYYITGRVTGAKLPDFYGAAALHLNYPNEWDRINGRSGGGIWLHGTPPTTFSRPPMASDGCVILTNADLAKLENSIDIGKTPVVISDQAEFVNQATWDAERNGATRLLENWRHDIESEDLTRVLKNYSGKFRSGLGEDLTTWFEKNKAGMSIAHVSVKLRDMTLFRYPGRQDVIVGTFTQETSFGRVRNSVRKRQYWTREGNQWKIIFEGNV